MITAEPIPNVTSASDARATIRWLAEKRGLDLSAGSIQQIMIDNPDLNMLRLYADEWSFAYKRTANEFRTKLTKAQRHSWAACGPYKLPNGKVNEVYSDRSE